MEYYAHIRQTEQGDIVRQTLEAHLRACAETAAESLSGCGMEKSAYLAGLLHDMGKYTDAFQQYLSGETNQKRGSVIHTFQGCRFLMEKFHDPQDYSAEITSELLAYAVGAHHGLFDCVSPEHTSGLRHRIDHPRTDYAEAVTGFFGETDEREVQKLFLDAQSELYKKALAIWEKYGDDDSAFCFELGLLARLLLSAVIEGDRRDTAQFMSGRCSGGEAQDISRIWDSRLEYLERKLDAFPKDAEIAKARREISERCKAFASEPVGIYRLNVPTGGGKTLASLRYALAHAIKYKKKRLIFTSPLLSILEQNAKVIREFLGDDGIVLEHHSNVLNTDDDADSLDQRELLIQSWDSPVIITTMVQLLNTLFSGKTTAIRRFHALSESVIVIDEIQTLPPKLLSMFNLAIRFLSEQCGATVVLCSATQPSLENAQRALRPTPRDIIDPNDSRLLGVFSRTELVPLPNMRFEELSGLIVELMEKTDSLLVVCNTKREAARLLGETKSSEWDSFHLSAAMCMQHRRDTVSALNAALSAGRKTLCVSTQVIEAGVDISFGCVLRLMAGMDSVVQSAGRCNRNGEAGRLRPVYIVNCTDESLSMLRDIRRGKTATEELLEEYRRRSAAYPNGLASAKAIDRYYTCLYRDMEARLQDYPLNDISTTLLDLLSNNEKYADEPNGDYTQFRLWQAFKTAGRYFSVFDENTQDVLVPYGKGEALIAALNSEPNSEEMGRLLRQAGSYSASLYSAQLRRLESCGAVYPICGGSALALQPEFYDPVTGVTNEPGEAQYLEV